MNTGIKKDMQMALEYAIYMMIGDGFTKTKCVSRWNERSLLINYKEIRFKYQYKVEEICISYFETLKRVLPDDDDTKDLLEMFLKNTMNYASIREEWYFMKREERLERDAGRTRAHESLISSVKYLKRYLVNLGKDVSFFGVLEDENEII